MIEYKELGAAATSAFTGVSDIQWGVTYVNSNLLGTLDSNGRDVITTPKSVVSLVPIVILLGNGRSLLPAGVHREQIPYEQARMPVLQTVDPTFTLRLSGTRLEVLDEHSRTELEIDLDKRTAWFVRLIGNVGFVLQDRQDTDSFALATLALDNLHPMVAHGFHPGSITSKNAANILLNSKKWEANYPDLGSPGSYSGVGVDVGDRQWTFYSDRHVHYPPRTFPRSCLVCESTTVNREHCTPNWLAHALQLEPIVAEVLCNECNSKLGDELEVPVSDMYKQDTMGESENLPLLNLWMAKTAATLGAAANLPIPTVLQRTIATGRVDPHLRIWAEATSRASEPFYRFSVIRFAPPREALGWFVVGFEFPGFSFVVAHLPIIDPTITDSLAMTHPERTKPLQAANISRVLEVMQKLMGGLESPIDVFADAVGRTPAPRSPRKMKSADPS
ncbi:hypothetical protein ACL00U_16715 [Curtobacterium poinsettiae]|uniref:hypothetical protein n=1 Tax=Curtobacterium poinsettiae TaxID=159612 RepID=UPI00399EFD79